MSQTIFPNDPLSSFQPTPQLIEEGFPPDLKERVPLRPKPNLFFECMIETLTGSWRVICFLSGVIGLYLSLTDSSLELGNKCDSLWIKTKTTIVSILLILMFISELSFQFSRPKYGFLKDWKPFVPVLIISSLLIVFSLSLGSSLLSENISQSREKNYSQENTDSNEKILYKREDTNENRKPKSCSSQNLILYSSILLGIIFLWIIPTFFFVHVSWNGGDLIHSFKLWIASFHPKDTKNFE